MSEITRDVQLEEIRIKSNGTLEIVEKKIYYETVLIQTEVEDPNTHSGFRTESRPEKNEISSSITTRQIIRGQFFDSDAEPLLVREVYKLIDKFFESPKKYDSPDWQRFNLLLSSDIGFKNAFNEFMSLSPSTAIILPVAITQIETKGIEAFTPVYSKFKEECRPPEEVILNWKELARSCYLPTAFINML